MQKGINVKTKKEVILIMLVLFSFFGFSQDKLIKAADDYKIINKSIGRYFINKKKNDSIFLEINKDILNDSVPDKFVKIYLRRRKQRDTLHINAIADKFYYKQFLSKKARWHKDKTLGQKFGKELDSIFSNAEITNYYKQLNCNNYLWDKSKINHEEKVFIHNDLKLTREEIKQLPEEKKNIEIKKVSEMEDRLNLYTFSKPIYSINKDYALIAYNSGGANILNIFENINNKWKFIIVLDNNLIICKVF